METDLHVLHIIPSAFDYFDDIKKYAFGLVGEMNANDGVFADVFTLQYGPPTKAEKVEVGALSPDQEYKGSEPVKEAVDDFEDYNVVHLHTPFFGAAKDIISWKNDNPNIPLVITYYRDVEATDLMALVIKWYNNYYLKKLFKMADIITVFPWSENKARRLAGDKEQVKKVVLLSEFGAGDPKSVLEKNLNLPSVVDNLFNIYSYLI